MATTPAVKKNKSAVKRARQAKARTLRNRSIKSLLNTFSKKVETEVKNKNMDSAKNALKKVTTAIDKAALKGVIHRNTASRRVSRLTRLVNSLSPSEAA